MIDSFFMKPTSHLLHSFWNLSVLLGVLALPAASYAAAAPAAAPKPPAWSANAASDKPLLEQSEIFTGGEGGYPLYRIPGLAVTTKGTILAFVDARKAASDWAQIDIAMRRSTDGGTTWSPQKIVINTSLHEAEGIKFEPNETAVAQKLGGADRIPISNQVPIVDRQTGAVHLLHCVNYARAFYQRSDDDGVTFSAPVEITRTFEEFKAEYPWKVIATGPNHGIQLTSGRLIVPIWMSRGGGPGGHRPSVIATIYSDDHGATWKRGAIVTGEVDPLINPNETIALELSDGNVMLNIRHESLQHRRAISYSPDGISQWTRPELVNDLYEPVCMAGIERLTTVKTGGKSRIIFSNPHNATDPIPNHESRFYVRKNMSLKVSYDEGRTWPVNKTLEAGPSLYSDLAVLPDGTICCLYERRVPKEGKQVAVVTFARLNLAWITDGKDHL
jgi:sialidase-1